METALQTAVLGYPRIGSARELKLALEAHWAGRLDEGELRRTAKELRRRHWSEQKDAGIALIPSNDFSLYDQVLDMTCLLGAIPRRFETPTGTVSLETYFAMARGRLEQKGEGGARACEMTKWFDTNYHFLVPELRPDTRFSLASDKPFDEFLEASEHGIRTVPVLLGPVTWLSLAKPEEGAPTDFDPLSLLEGLLPVYQSILRRLADLGAQWVRIDEPVLATDLSPRQRQALSLSWSAMASTSARPALWAASYFGPLGDNLPLLASLPAEMLHLDAVRAPGELEALAGLMSPDQKLSLGVVDGRNIWKTDLGQAMPLLVRARALLGEARVVVASSCSLQHVPHGLAAEDGLDPVLEDSLAFAAEKLEEIALLARLPGESWEDAPRTRAHQAGLLALRADPRRHREDVRRKLSQAGPAHLERSAPYPARRAVQDAAIPLPEFPTTTIGSFPQTDDIRKARAAWRKGQMPEAAYQAFLERKTLECVRIQEELGLDVLVHGEFERTDMVEFFGEKLEGFAFTRNGWVQSYGSRCVKPPVLFADVARLAPMTVDWARLAQGMTSRPMKGMLTGPVTILQWSFVRDDQPRSETARQIALALRDEIADLEAAGIAIIQIDEPALREGLPLRKADQDAYLAWAVSSFRLAAAVAKDRTQIHTHMCYSEFNDIIAAIADMDADVITIETSRSNMELLEAFVDFRYPNAIGPGVYDIHSPRIPALQEMEGLMRKALDVLPARALWVNPDCGLKTRSWEETIPALGNMVECARRLRSRAH